MKIVIVHMLFAIIISAFMAFQIKTSYFYQTAWMLYCAERQRCLLETLLAIAIEKLKSGGSQPTAFEETRDIGEYQGVILHQSNGQFGQLTLMLKNKNSTIKECYSYQTHAIKGKISVKLIKQF